MKKMINQEQIDFLKSNVKGRSLKELTTMFNDKFNTQLKETTIKRYKTTFHLKSGVDTKFKKNEKPHNWLPLFAEFKDVDGYWWIKTAEPNTWERKHKYIYEQHYGKIPKGYSVVFLDTNKDNFDIDNLKAIKIKEKLIMKNLHLFSTDKDITETGLLLTQMINKMYDRRKFITK